jgi:hypothetical protein
MWVGEGNAYLLGKGQRFFFTPSALRNLLLQQRHLFGDVELHRSGHKHRRLLIAHRRRIGRLVVVAGPTAVGKSTFIQRMKQGATPELADRLGVAGFADFEVLSADALGSDRRCRFEGLILHYDSALPRVEEHSWSYERDPALDLLACAECVSFVSLTAPAATLRKRLVQSEFGGRVPRDGVDLHRVWQRLPPLLQGFSLGVTRRLRRSRYFDLRLKRVASLPRHRRLYELYQSDDAVEKLHEAWRAFVRGIDADRVEIDVSIKPG